jgi:hypothetical protein
VTGPNTIDWIFDSHAVRLSDCVTGESVMNGKRVGVGRLICFAYPPQCLEVDAEVNVPSISYALGDSVIIHFETRLHVAKIVKVYEVGEQCEVQVFEVPSGERYGPWNRRPLHPRDAAPIVIAMSDVIQKVPFTGKALTSRSIDKLATAGYMTLEPTKEKGLIALGQ